MMVLPRVAEPQFLQPGLQSTCSGIYHIAELRDGSGNSDSLITGFSA